MVRLRDVHIDKVVSESLFALDAAIPDFADFVAIEGGPLL